MSIYDRTTKELMHDFAKTELEPGKVFSRRDAQKWFAAHYPKIKSNTVGMHVDGMAVNAARRKHSPNIRRNEGWDLFWKLPDGNFRLWDQTTDSSPKYRDDFLSAESAATPKELDEDAASDSEGTGEFAAEKHLQDYLVRNLASVEQGLRLYEVEGFNGIEFPAGGRYIDLLAVDGEGNFVVIELKVSRGYDRTIGQILRYMGWVEKNIADGKRVRGIIVASEISEDLRLAASRIPDVKLMEYEISFKLKPVIEK